MSALPDLLKIPRSLPAREESDSGDCSDNDHTRRKITVRTNDAVGNGRRSRIGMLDGRSAAFMPLQLVSLRDVL